MRVTAALITLAAVGGTLALNSTPAVAQEIVSIRYMDLDLASSAGRATLSARIATGAARVCGAVPAAGLKEIHNVRACRTAATARAWNQISAAARSGMIHGAR